MFWTPDERTLLAGAGGNGAGAYVPVGGRFERQEAPEPETAGSTSGRAP